MIVLLGMAYFLSGLLMFTDLHGEARYVLHYPNDFYKERPHFYRLKEAGDGLELE